MSNSSRPVLDVVALLQGACIVTSCVWSLSHCPFSDSCHSATRSLEDNQGWSQFHSEEQLAWLNALLKDAIPKIHGVIDRVHWNEEVDSFEVLPPYSS